MACAFVLALILPLFVTPAITARETKPQDAVEQVIPMLQRGSTEEPTRPEPTTAPRLTPEPVRPTAIPERPTDPPRPTAAPVVPTAIVVDPEPPAEQPQPIEPTAVSRNDAVETAFVSVIPYDCVTTKSSFVDWYDAIQSCSQQTVEDVGFTLVQGATSTYDVAEMWKGTSAPTAMFPYVPIGQFTLERDPPSTGASRTDVWCAEQGQNEWINHQLIPVSGGGVIQGAVTEPGVWRHCLWVNVTVDASLTLAPATVPVLVPKDIPQLVPICDPELVLTDQVSQCVPLLPEEFETMQLCVDDPGFGDQSSTCEVDVVVINESYWLYGSTIQVIPITCAEHMSGWQTIDDVYAGCVDPTPATGWGFNLTINGDTSPATSLQDPVHGALASWHAVPEGDFTIAQDFVPNDVETVAFCSWEAQNTEAEGLEYVAAYDLLMPVREGGAGSFSGSIDFPGTDYLCVWFNFPEPKRFQP